MYKDLGSMIITGSTVTGKTLLMQRYIDEVLNDKKKVIIVDPKMVEHHKYKKFNTVLIFFTYQRILFVYTSRTLTAVRVLLFIIKFVE